MLSMARKAKLPKVSVIVPTFNEEKNIKRLLVSVNNQSYGNIESIVVDDGSTDKTVIIAKKFATKVYPREHAERSVQRNFGVAKSSGKYVLILDADMELSPKVIENCVYKSKSHKLLIIPEKTTGRGFIATLRKFEREMYEGDQRVEVARFFDKETFDEFGGYDPKLTGPEDYDLPYRISKKYKIGRIREYLFHHEGELTFLGLLRKRFYYANKGAYYAQKHPELLFRQGILIFRPAYFENWRKFFQRPFVGLSFIVIRVFETLSAGLGYLVAIILK